MASWGSDPKSPAAKQAEAGSSSTNSGSNVSRTAQRVLNKRWVGGRTEEKLHSAEASRGKRVESSG